ncbi:MAG: DUF58 domain-containing protein [Clostridia bacterium]|jgi:hypothetical protein|nr:DUF58 domain-containing protein [Clostridia bacterium]
MELILIVISLVIFFAAEIMFFKFFVLRNIEYSLRFSQDEAYEGDDIFIDEIINNNKNVFVPWLKADIHASKWLQFANTSSSIIDEERCVSSGFSLKGHQKVTRRWYTRCAKRGVFTIVNTTLTAGDLLGIMQDSEAFPANTRLMVFPGVLRLEEAFFSNKDLMGDMMVKRFIMDDPFIIKGTREYVQGDPLNRVNWKATARMQKLMVRENDFTAKKGITVLLNIKSYALEYIDVKYKDVIELGIKVVNTILERGYGMGFPLRLGTNAGIMSNPEEMIFTDSISGPEHIRHLKVILAELILKNHLDFPEYIEKHYDEIYDTQVYIVSAYLNDEIIEKADILRRNGNTVKFLILNYTSDAASSRGMEVFLLDRNTDFLKEGEYYGKYGSGKTDKA